MYSIDDFDRPSVAADIVVFGIDRSGSDSKSKNLELKILLIRRGEEPFLGRLSLPGGFLRKGETIGQTALRELSEEAGVSDPKLIQFGVYSQADRDPRGWIISCAFLALTDTVTLSTAEDSDAADAHEATVGSVPVPDFRYRLRSEAYPTEHDGSTAGLSLSYCCL